MPKNYFRTGAGRSTLSACVLATAIALTIGAVLTIIMAPAWAYAQDNAGSDEKIVAQAVQGDSSAKDTNAPVPLPQHDHFFY